MIQHVMYKDILEGRRYVSYPYYDRFDINDKKCLYCYRDHEREMHEYLRTKTTREIINNSLIATLKEKYEISDEHTEKMLKLFSADNPSVRLTVYAGGQIDRAKVFQDIYDTNDIKRTFIELTGEINAFAMDGLFSLYASALYYLEGKEDTPNAEIIKQSYNNLINGSYIYMKRGTAMEFFFMPIEDIAKATNNRDVEMLMDSVENFTDVYIRNNVVSDTKLF